VSRASNFLILAAVALVAITVVQAAFAIGQGYLNESVLQPINSDVRMALYDKLTTAPPHATMPPLNSRLASKPADPCRAAASLGGCSIHPNRTKQRHLTTPAEWSERDGHNYSA